MTHSRDVIRRLLAEGWVMNHVKGSHHQFKHPRKTGKVTVPHPNKDLPAGTLAAPGTAQAGLSTALRSHLLHASRGICTSLYIAQLIQGIVGWP